MHQVKIYDDSGNLKKVISVKALQERSDLLIESPSLIRKTHGDSKPAAKPSEFSSHEKNSS